MSQILPEEEEGVSLFAPLPKGPYGAILADPP